MNNGNGHSDMTADEAAIELCEAIETAFSPFRMMNISDGGLPSECMVKFTRAFDPAYEGLEKRYQALDNKSDDEVSVELSNTVLDMQIIDFDARFLMGILWGMKSAGKSVDEIKKSAIAMLARDQSA